MTCLTARSWPAWARRTRRPPDIRPWKAAFHLGLSDRPALAQYIQSMNIAHSPKQFLVIDDHPLFCEALSLTLGAVETASDVVTAHSLADGFRQIDDGVKPDAILLDLNLPDVVGVDGLIRLRTRVPDTPVVVISSHDDSRIISSVLNAGAAGFISKQSAKDELEEALHRIWNGETYAPAFYQPPARVEGEVEDHEDSIARLQTLTPQQSRILELVCEGKLNKQIAYDMSIAETTVKAHITAILRKLKVQSRTQAVLIAQKAHFSSILQNP